MAPTQTVRDALRNALSERGHAVQSDTYGRGNLYLMGDRDLAIALFEFHETAREAIDAMYQGAWTAGLPPRFAVLPKSAESEDSFELLEQMRVIPVLYTPGDSPEFPTLDRLLAEHLG
jgi:hypothetical protein